MNRPRVLLVFGGDSSEHEVSCLTAASVVRAIDTERFDVTCVGITKQGRWVIADPAVVARYQISDGLLPTVDPSLPDAVLQRGPHHTTVARVDGDRLVDAAPIDVAFAVLHGPFGEDGTIQGLFEMMGIRYVGAGVLSSAVCQDKHAMKVELAGRGLPVGPYVNVPSYRWRDDSRAVIDEINQLSYPLFVKPARGGSSLGIVRVASPADLEQAITSAQQYDPNLVVEQGFVGAKEIECAVLQQRGGAPLVSQPGEIIVETADRFYDFSIKYLPDQPVRLAIPAELDEAAVATVQQLAARAFDALGVEGLARIDFFLTESGEFVVNELNTMPGFTPTSMYPKLWQHEGLSYPDLVGRLLDLALERPLGLR